MPSNNTQETSSFVEILNKIHNERKESFTFSNGDTLFEEQHSAIDTTLKLMREEMYAVISHACGLGKTHQLAYLAELSYKAKLAYNSNIVESGSPTPLQVSQDIILTTGKISAQNAHTTLNKLGITCKFLTGKSEDKDAQALITTVQKLQTELKKGVSIHDLVRLNGPHILFGDEIHNLLTSLRKETIEKFNNALRIGFSATPKKDHKRFPSIWGKVSHEISLEEAILTGKSVPPIYFAFSANIPQEYIQISRGDYDSKLLEKGLKQAEILGSISQIYKMLIGEKHKEYPTLIAVPTKNLVNEVVKKMKADYPHLQIAGWTGNTTSKAKLKKQTQQFKEGEIDILVACKMAHESLNLENLCAVIDGFPTTKRDRVEQLAGRPARKNEGKDHFLYAQIIPQSNTFEQVLLPEIFATTIQSKTTSLNIVPQSNQDNNIAEKLEQIRKKILKNKPQMHTVLLSAQDIFLTIQKKQKNSLTYEGNNALLKGKVISIPQEIKEEFKEYLKTLVAQNRITQKSMEMLYQHFFENSQRKKPLKSAIRVFENFIDSIYRIPEDFDKKIHENLSNKIQILEDPELSHSQFVDFLSDFFEENSSPLTNAHIKGIMPKHIKKLDILKVKKVLQTNIQPTSYLNPFPAITKDTIEYIHKLSGIYSKYLNENKTVQESTNIQKVQFCKNISQTHKNEEDYRIHWNKIASLMLVNDFENIALKFNLYEDFFELKKIFGSIFLNLSFTEFFCNNRSLQAAIYETYFTERMIQNIVLSEEIPVTTNYSEELIKTKILNNKQITEGKKHPIQNFSKIFMRLWRNNCFTNTLAHKTEREQKNKSDIHGKNFFIHILSLLENYETMDATPSSQHNTKYGEKVLKNPEIICENFVKLETLLDDFSEVIEIGFQKGDTKNNIVEMLKTIKEKTHSIKGEVENTLQENNNSIDVLRNSFPENHILYNESIDIRAMRLYLLNTVSNLLVKDYRLFFTEYYKNQLRERELIAKLRPHIDKFKTLPQE